MTRALRWVAAAVTVVGWRRWIARRCRPMTTWAPPGGTLLDEALHARVVGQGRCELVLLHGMFNSGLYWGAAYDGLSGTGGVVAPDLLGFGRSPPPERRLHP